MAVKDEKGSYVFMDNSLNQGAEMHLEQLGRPTTFPQSPQEAKLERIPNRWPDTDCRVQIICDEFTCLCPLTKQPDFAKIFIEYCPDEHLIESKSLKLYLGSYRSIGIFHEFVTNAICHDLVNVLQPKYIEVKAEFTVRGGIRITPIVRWKK